jgi:hypothetical protein
MRRFESGTCAGVQPTSVDNAVGDPHPAPVRVWVRLSLVAVAAFVTLPGCASQGGRTRVLSGWAYVPVDRHSLACCGESAARSGGQSFVLAGTAWRDDRDPGSTWQIYSDGPVGCLTPGAPNRVRLTYVRTRVPDKSVAFDDVVSVECLP